MNGKHLPTSTNASRAGISGCVSGNLASPNLTSPEQQTYAEPARDRLFQERCSASSAGIHEWMPDQRPSRSRNYPGGGSMARLPSSPDTQGFSHCLSTGVHDGATNQPDSADHAILRGPPRTIRGEYLQHVTSYIHPPGRVGYDFEYEASAISHHNSPCDLEGRGGLWLTPMAEEIREIGSDLELPSPGFCSGVGEMTNATVPNSPYTGTHRSKESSWGYGSNGYYSSPPHSPDPGQQIQEWPNESPDQMKPRRQRTHDLASIPPTIPAPPFKCNAPGCDGRFKRQEHLKRHLKSHTNEKPYVCWVPDCNKSFSRNDNLNVHYTTTHGKKGGRNRYVATLDESSSDYDPNFRGGLTSDGRPLR
ncbi:zinc finger protein BrlA [[Emmonsia] crescens]|uniref:Zinc finger protein BrlA n=1 Tax=[Emmonsia] crescens TaxID=73230 RepID=A0A2B7ZD32_9EURO|nr:zinc finger protein BrlA [Emmonsia crescens]